MMLRGFLQFASESRLAARTEALSDSCNARPTVDAPGKLERAMTLSRCRSLKTRPLVRLPLEQPPAAHPIRSATIQVRDLGVMAGLPKSP
jgi:hypothetical protein